MNNINNIKVKNSSTIKEAMQIIDKGSLQIALVVDNNDVLIGTLTDGDIRRGLLNGMELNSIIEPIVSTSPTVSNIRESNEEIINKALKKNLRHIPIVDDLGRVVDIKQIDEFIRPKQKSNKVVLMAGGLGERLRPLTIDTPKPMLKVGDQPILHTIIQKFAENGYSDFVICLNYKSNVIKDYFEDGSRFGVSISYVIEDKRLGTAGALSLIELDTTDPFFVMNGDLLTNINFSQLHEYHILNNSVGTMCVRDYNFQIPYGVVNILGNKISSIIEKPSHKFFVNAGIYMLSPDALEYIPKDEFYDMPSLFEDLIKNNKNTISFPIREYWLDIGRIEEYNKANEEFNKFF